MANTVVVSEFDGDVDRQSDCDFRISSDIPGYTEKTSTVSKVKTSGMYLFQGSIKHLNLSNEAEKILHASWRGSTQQRYECTYKKWESFCNKGKVDPFQPNVRDVLHFLTDQFENSLGYKSICLCRSALNAIITLPGYSDISKHPLIKRFLKGVFNIRPPKAPSILTWDVGIVLNHIKNWGPNVNLTFRKLNFKLVLLLLLASGTRVNTLQALTMSGLNISSEACTFMPGKLLKHSRPNYIHRPLVFKRFVNEDLCPYLTIKFYLQERSKWCPSVDSFIITYGKPHRPATADTISRWVKSVLKECHIDTSVFRAHSCRSASTSAAESSGTPINEILNNGDWSNARTFQKWYWKTVQKETFADNVLSKGC